MVGTLVTVRASKNRIRAFIACGARKLRVNALIAGGAFELGVGTLIAVDACIFGITTLIGAGSADTAQRHAILILDTRTTYRACGTDVASTVNARFILVFTAIFTGCTGANAGLARKAILALDGGFAWVPFAALTHIGVLVVAVVNCQELVTVIVGHRRVGL